LDLLPETDGKRLQRREPALENREGSTPKICKGAYGMPSGITDEINADLMVLIRA
jgi:hypothetical protein